MAKGITELNVDVVVNAANERLQHGGGVCGMIFDAAGPSKLQAACDSIGYCKTGSAVITPAYNLKGAKYIIHAVGPRWAGGKNNEPQQLYGAYERSLELAKENGCKSIGFPLISAGIFGYPLEAAWQIAIKSCGDFLDENPDLDISVMFAVPDENKRRVGERMLNEFTPASKKDNPIIAASSIIGFHRPSEPYGCFSNWFHAEFNLADHHYVNSEQYMMARKVSLARRYDLFEKIMNTGDPAKAKEYAGKEYFPEYASIKDIWERNAKHIVKCGVRAKFAQNPEILEALLNTGDALLAECAGQDTTWGIGINLHNTEWHNVSKWTGKNQLGVILMELREEFRKEISHCGAIQFIDFTDALPIDVWNMTAGQLKRIPQYYSAIHSYAAQLTDAHERNCFYYGYTLNDWDIAMRTNMGGGLPILGFYEMKQEIYEIYRRLSGKHYVSELFASKPDIWGLRGDPYFWDDLALCFAFTEFPITENELTGIIHDQFRKRTGEQLTENAVCYVEMFAHGGMSSGQVSGEFWVKTAIPMLKERLRLAKKKR